MMFRHLFVLAALLSASLHAQTGEIPTIRQSLTTLAWNEPVKGLYYLNGGEIEELKAYSGGFSLPFSYEGDPVIRFYSDRESLLLEPEERPRPVGVARLDPQLKHSLLIFARNDDGRFKIKSHNFSQKEFPLNSCRIFNFSDLQVVFAFGDDVEVYPIPPLGELIVSQEGLNDRNQMVKVQVAQAEGGEMRLVYRSNWRFDNQSRNTVFVLPGTKEGGSVKMRKFVERGLKPEDVEQ
tara:strand:- start:14069 stop:14779 length:711 start_codon:yes stop_codon:yes gene_type:complete